MEDDLETLENLKFIENCDADGDTLTLIIDGEDFVVKCPDYPNGEAIATIRGRSIGLKRGNLVAIAKEVYAHVQSGNFPRVDSDRQETFVMGSLEPCTEFNADVDRMKTVFGPNSVSFEKIESFSEGQLRAKVLLKLDPAPLMNKMIAECYRVDRDSPIILELIVSDLTTYNDMRDTKLSCYQTTRESALAAQLERILKHPGRLVKIWETDEKAPTRPPPARTTTPPPPPVKVVKKDKKKRATQPLTKEQQERKDAILHMNLAGVDEKVADKACRIAKTADHAAHIILEEQHLLVSDEEIVAAEFDSHAEDQRQREQLDLIMAGKDITLSDEEDPNKGIPARHAGFLVQLMEYLISRIRTCSTYCVICDKTHLFAGGAMLKPAVCSRELCAFAFHALKVGANAADEIATDSGVIDLLVVMLKAAAFSTRTDRILSPYPQVVDPTDPKKLAIDPKSPDIAKLKKILENFPSVRSLSQANDIGDIKRKLDALNPLAFPLMQWTVSSNRSHIVKLRKEDHLVTMSTPHQYMLLTAPPEKQARFQQLKAKYGSKFAFHGSNIENWHCILREGLKNASGTALQLNGTAHGSGIYFAPTASTSLGYCRTYELKTGTTQKATGDDKLSENFINERNMICMALCEIVNHDIKDHGWCWTLEHEDHVVTRFFFVYDPNNTGSAGNADTKTEAFVKEVTEALAKHGIV